MGLDGVFVGRLGVEMITIKFGRDTNSVASGMSAKRWKGHVKHRRFQATRHDIEVAIKRNVNHAIRDHLLKMETKRQEVMKNWTKQP